MRHFTFDQLPAAIGELHEKLELIERLIISQSSPNQTEQDELLTIKEAAQFLHLSVPTLYGKVHMRELPFSKQGKRLYFSKAELTDWVKSGRRKTQTELAQETDAYLTRKRR